MGARRLIRIGAVLVVAFAIIGTARSRVAQPTPRWRPQFTVAAERIPFEEDRAPTLDRRVPRGIAIPDSIADLRIAFARTRDKSHTGRILFRIRSTRGNSLLGIAPGVNYVWSDIVKGKTRFLMIPGDSTKREHWLNVRPHLHDRPMTGEGLYVMDYALLSQQNQMVGGTTQQVMMACACTTKNCLSSWCSGCDTSKATTTIIPPPIAAMRRYFARYNVSFPVRP